MVFRGCFELKKADKIHRGFWIMQGHTNQNTFEKSFFEGNGVVPVFLSELQKCLEKENRIDKAESLKTTGFPLYFYFPDDLRL
jgi:hypothetical protein